jgi:hypothetical protein
VGHGFTGCGKIPKVSFRGRGLPEESAFFLGLVKKQIPRFARDDIKLLISAASSAAGLLKTELPHSLFSQWVFVRAEPNATG